MRSVGPERTQRFFAIAADLIGAPTDLVDETGDIAWRARTTLWGTTTWTRTCTACTRCASPASTTTPRPASTTTSSATTTRKPGTT